MKKIAIIGAGYTGLAMAKKLIENGFDVTIFEKENDIGGIAQTVNLYDKEIEKHYRHIFKSDKYVINLLKELNLLDKLKWIETKMGYYTNNSIYTFGTPISLLKFKPLNYIEKIRFGLSIINIRLIKNYKNLEKYTAKEWIINNYGKKIYETIWEPLLNSKFGNEKEIISMSWLWGKICLRSSSSTLNGEKLGYLKGSYGLLTKKIEQYLKERNCKIYTNMLVENVLKKDNMWEINSGKIKEKFDVVVSTVAYPITQNIFHNYLDEEELEKINKLEYTCAKTLVLISKKSLTNYYWINIGDNTFPFGGVIEHTNMISKEEYNNKNIIYISNYMYKDQNLYKMQPKELINYYFPFIKKLNKNFKISDIEEVLCYEEDFAQPIIKKEYSEKILNSKLNAKGLYVAGMAQIYPEDRGMNYAIKIGEEVAIEIIDTYK